MDGRYRALLTERERELLRKYIDGEEVDPNRIYDIRTKVGKRIKNLVIDLEILAESSNDEILDELRDETKFIDEQAASIHSRIDTVESKLEEFQVMSEEVDALQSELEEIKRSIQCYSRYYNFLRTSN